MYSTFTIFCLFFLSSLLLGNGLGLYSNPVAAQKTNEAKVNADIEQENKCKKDTECENENELNNKLNLVNKTIIQIQKTQNIIQPEEPQENALLHIHKNGILCEDQTGSGLCNFDLEDIDLTVTGNNPVVSDLFPGLSFRNENLFASLGPGSFIVTVIVPVTPPAGIALGISLELSGDCTETTSNEIFGTIANGQYLTCGVTTIMIPFQI